MPETFQLTINGREHAVDADPEMPLLYLLRNRLEFNGAKFGCGLEQCGACLVLIDGISQPSCQLPVHEAAGREITTLEGLAAPDGTLHPVQQAFIDEQAAQCGYCLSGLVIAAVDLLNHNPDPDDAEIRRHLDRNICRCGIHDRAIRAIRRAAREGPS